MDFAFTEEQDALREAARDYLAGRYPPGRVVEIADRESDGTTRGWDEASWRELRGLGWLDDELSFLETAVLLEESGRALLPAPYFVTTALAHVALADGDPGQAVERPTTLAWAEPGGPVTLAAAATAPLATTADRDGRVTGAKAWVPDATSAADVVVVTGDGLYLVDLSEAGVQVTERSTVDRTRRLSDVTLNAAQGRRIAGLDLLPALGRRALASAAIEAVGVGHRAHDIAVEHVRQREQFGRPIGSFQAVAHRVTDGYVALTLARSLAYWAAWAVAVDDEEAERAVTAARAAAGEAAVTVCEGAIQVLGGTGFTWDHVLHRLYKRALWLDGFEGSAAAHRARLAALLLD
jgi:alkylation response protein AidB-like acyl-CoA dehydrogenase